MTRCDSTGAGALHAYKKALDIYRGEHPGRSNNKQPLANGNHKSAMPLNPRLLNNAAVMYMRSGNYQVALELVEEAIQVTQTLLDWQGAGPSFKLSGSKDTR